MEAERLRLMAQVRAEDGGPRGDWVVLAEAGTGAAIASDTAREVFSAPEVAIRLELGMGGAEATVWTCDMTEDYVRMNTKADGTK